MRAHTIPRLRAVLAAGALAAGIAAPFVAQQAVAGTALAASPAEAVAAAGLTPYLGALHEHSAYSDGYPGTNPGTYYASGRSHGLDFMMGSDHSDTFAVPLAASEECLGPGVVNCPGGDPSNPVGTLHKWDETQKYAAAATDASYSAVRGFEWTSDRYGHINVFFSKNYNNAKTDGGYAAMSTFYDWFNRRPELGGGSDGLATFNHAGDKKLQGAPQDGDLNWNHFAYDARSDDRMVGIETYNSGVDKDTKSSQAPSEGYYAYALDRGWHLGPIGAEDIGHDRGDDWGNVSAGGTIQAKTVILATQNTPAALRAAMLARRFYAVYRPEIRMGFTVDGNLMGSRLTRAAGTPLSIAADVTWPGHSGLRLDLVTTEGVVVGSGTDTLSLSRATSATEKYYFVRVMDGTTAVAFSAPVWVTAGATGQVGEWLAGDLHVHTCYSHDAYCPTGDPSDPTGDVNDNTDPDEAYTFGGSVDERFTEASVRGLDYLAITDHNDDGHPEESGAKSVNDPAFGSHGVVGVPGYENSLSGHGQMLGATHVYPAGSKSAADVNAMADALRADGGVFQANHPEDDIATELTDCAGANPASGPQSWRYGYDVRVDSVEVWNVEQYLQPPFPGNSPNKDNLRYWECSLNRGAHVAATGGSDSHWMSTAAAQGVGNPTAAGVLQAIREGRTAISATPPSSGGAPLLLEADRDRDGTFESTVGDTVPPGTPMRVRSASQVAAGLVEVRANDATLLADAPLTPGGAVTFTSPAEAGWVYARLRAAEAVEERRTACDSTLGQPREVSVPIGSEDVHTTYCRAPVGVLAMTSAMYLGIDVDPTPTETVSPTPTETVSPTPTETVSPTPTASPCPTNGSGRDKCKTPKPHAGPTSPTTRPVSRVTPIGVGLGLLLVIAAGLLLARPRVRRH
jgi:predicted metal-dependent phosphoesterase TrpH